MTRLKICNDLSSGQIWYKYMDGAITTRMCGTYKRFIPNKNSLIACGIIYVDYMGDLWYRPR